MEKPEFSPARRQQIKELRTHYPPERQKSALLPVLHMAQDDFGWLSVEVMDMVAETLELLPIEVYEVATFYSMYHMQPVGKWVLEVCRTGPCMLRGSDELISHLENRLGIKAGQTTADGMFTLKGVECLASCGSAPMMQVFDDYYENLTPESTDALLEEFRARTAERPDYFAGSTV